jgi:hypothetical protein
MPNEPTLPEVGDLLAAFAEVSHQELRRDRGEAAEQCDPSEAHPSVERSQEPAQPRSSTAKSQQRGGRLLMGIMWPIAPQWLGRPWPLRTGAVRDPRISIQEGARPVDNSHRGMAETAGFGCRCRGLCKMLDMDFREVFFL